MSDRATKPTRWWLIIGLFVLALVLFGIAWMYFAGAPGGHGTLQSEQDASVPTVVPAPASSSGAPETEPSDIMPDATVPPASTDERVTMTELKAVDAYAKGLNDVALSPAEVEWMNRNGVTRSSHAYTEAYKNFSLDKLESMAESGDVNAARVGAVKAFGMAMNAFAPDVKEAMWPESLDDLSESEMQEREMLVQLAFTSDLWQRQRHLLWLGVVHGSSFAANRMTFTYKSVTGRCYALAECGAWALVAWRMGAWDVSASASNAQSEHVRLSVAINYANQIWSKINQARTELGMPPLRLDLRPNYEVWQEFKTKDGLSPPIYRR